MKRIYLLLLPILLCQPGCAPTLHTSASVAASTADAIGLKPPRPCAATTGDEKAVTALAKSVTVAALMLSALARNNVPGFVKGTPSAVSIGKGLDDARKGVNAAQEARLACDAKSYKDGLARAESAYAIVQSALGA